MVERVVYTLDDGTSLISADAAAVHDTIVD